MLSKIEPRALYRDLFDIRRDFDEMFSRFRFMTDWPTVSEPKLSWEYMPPVEVGTDPEAKKFYVRVAVPGVDPKDMKVEVRGNALTITGERKTDETKKGIHYSHREFTYGSFERVVPLPDGVEVGKLTAEFNQGVLEISAPIATAALPRHIEIKPTLRKAA